MESVKITTIDGEESPKKCHPFIIIESKNISSYLKTKYANDYLVLSEIDMVKINILLSSKKLPLIFKPLGDIMIDKTLHTIPTKIILANENIPITKYPIDYKKIGSLYDGFLWKPICQKSFTGLGLIYSKQKPLVNQYITVQQRYVTQILPPFGLISRCFSGTESDCNKKSICPIVISNIYHLFSLQNGPKFTINMHNFFYTFEEDDTPIRTNKWIPVNGRNITLQESLTPWYKNYKNSNTSIKNKKTIEKFDGYNYYGVHEYLSIITLILLVFIIILSIYLR